jgi:hypothetical protein
MLRQRNKASILQRRQGAGFVGGKTHLGAADEGHDAVVAGRRVLELAVGARDADPGRRGDCGRRWHRTSGRVPTHRASAFAAICIRFSEGRGAVTPDGEGRQQHGRIGLDGEGDRSSHADMVPEGV